jgi:predicted O-methyltransferase YrrM
LYESAESWRAVDAYFIDTLVKEDPTLLAARELSRSAGLPDHEVAPNQAKLLWMLCRMIGAKRVLEFGTLAGYSTIWFARAVGTGGHVTTFEIDPAYADVARRNFASADVADRVRLIEGPASESARQLIDGGEQPYDLIFIDADKPNNPVYLDAAIQLAHPGTLIIGDNVVRNGAVVDPHSTDDRVRGSRALIEAMGSDDRLDATALQTVGVKGWDGFAIARVR